MEISGLANSSSSIAETGTKRDVDIAILKKGLDIAADTAVQLIQAVPAPQSPNLPSHLGNHVNTTA